MVKLNPKLSSLGPYVFHLISFGFIFFFLPCGVESSTASAFLVVLTGHCTLYTFFQTNKRVKMPTNFTVVPVEDAKGGSNSTAAAGGGRPVTLGKLFEAEEDDDNSQGPHSGSVRQNIFFGL